MKDFEKANKLEEFIRKFIPNGFREAIGVFDFVPTITADNYSDFEKFHFNNVLIESLKKYEEHFIGYDICRFNKPYIVIAIQRYFEIDDVEVRDRECKWCGKTTKRTKMGICSECGRFN